MDDAFKLPPPRITPPLDPDFRPAVLANHAFLAEVRASGEGVPLRLGLERGDGSLSTYETQVFAEGSARFPANLRYVERLVKLLLWQRGGWRVMVGGPAAIGEHIRQVYSAAGPRRFDFDFMSEVYEHPFAVEPMAAEQVPDTRETTSPLGRHLDGCRIGFDLGASDYKVSAVRDGEPIWAEEFVWHPREQTDPSYHYEHVLAGLKQAAAHLPRVEAIGGSAAGVWINDRVLVASLFRGIPRELFEAQIKEMFVRMGREWGVPLRVVNDGEVTALAGSMELGDNAVLGIALGSSEAGGYVTPEGNITGWLNELAFVPFDYQPEAAQDEWSGDVGVGSQYLCQTGVIRLAARAGIALEEALSPAEKLKVVQDLMAAGDERVPPIFETVGVWLGYALAHYADFYDLRHVLILGRVTSGEGGHILLDRAQGVLAQEFPELADHIALHLPDESSRRIGQSVAAASLPVIG